MFFRQLLDRILYVGQTIISRALYIFVSFLTNQNILSWISFFTCLVFFIYKHASLARLSFSLTLSISLFLYACLSLFQSPFYSLWLSLWFSLSDSLSSFFLSLYLSLLIRLSILLLKFFFFNLLFLYPLYLSFSFNFFLKLGFWTSEWKDHDIKETIWWVELSGDWFRADQPSTRSSPVTSDASDAPFTPSESVRSVVQPSMLYSQLALFHQGRLDAYQKGATEY